MPSRGITASAIRSTRYRASNADGGITTTDDQAVEPRGSDSASKCRCAGTGGERSHDDIMVDAQARPRRNAERRSDWTTMPDVARQRNGRSRLGSVVSRSCAVGCIDMTSGIAAWLVQPSPDWPDSRPTPTPLRIQGRFSCRVLSGGFFFRSLTTLDGRTEKWVRQERGTAPPPLRQRP